MKKELSVLIPIYNCDCCQLVKALAEQAQLLTELNYELIIANEDKLSDGEKETIRQRFPQVQFTTW